MLSKAHRYIDAIPVDVVAFHNHITQIHADAEFNAAIRRKNALRSRIPR